VSGDAGGDEERQTDEDEDRAGEPGPQRGAGEEGGEGDAGADRDQDDAGQGTEEGGGEASHGLAFFLRKGPTGSSCGHHCSPPQAGHGPSLLAVVS
jgi:hypothetical protein